MRTRIIALLCGITVVLAAAAAISQPEPPKPAFTAHLTGAAEVPPVDTLATGQALFRLSRDGSQLDYRLVVANIENVIAAHIHLGPEGVNGPVVVPLFLGPPLPGAFSGVLAEGVITADELVGPLAGGALADLVAEIRAGNTYVNVHTTQHPGGEIRGQVR